MTGADRILAAVRDGQVRVNPVVILDWHDGPLAGIASMSGTSRLWRFTLLAHEPRSDDVDDRLFWFTPLPEEECLPLRAMLDSTAEPRLTWPFDDQPDPVAVSSVVDALMATDARAQLVVSMGTFDTVLRAWSVAD